MDRAGQWHLSDCSGHRLIRRGELDAIDQLLELPAPLAEVIRRTGDDPARYDLTGLESSLLSQGADGYAGAGNWPEAIAWQQRAIAAAPGSEQADELREILGYWYAYSSDVAAAEAILRPIASAAVGEDRVRVASRWAEALDRGGESVAADAIWAEFGPQPD